MSGIDGISVIICCYNSAQRILPTLKHLASQKVTGQFNFEVIVIDNNSSHNTIEVAHKIWSDLNTSRPLKVFQESKPGLAFAREAGIKNSLYELLIFCDDDNWLDQGYLQHAYDRMASNPLIGVLGGMGIAECELAPPTWFNAIKQCYAADTQGNGSEDVTETRGYVYGAGMVFRKQIWTSVLKTGFKTALTDRKKKSLSSGGDKEMCFLIRMAGYKIWYDDALRFKHFIPRERLTWDYLKRLFDGFAKADVYLDSFNDFRKYDLIDAKEMYRKKVSKLVWFLRGNLRMLSKIILKGRQEGDVWSLHLYYNFSQLIFLIKNKKSYLRFLNYLNDFYLKIQQNSK